VVCSSLFFMSFEKPEASALSVKEQVSSSTPCFSLDALAETILSELGSGKDVVLEAYPGFGKTRLAALLLSRAERGVVVTRTHKEVEEVFNFLPSTKGVVYAYGKPKICYKYENFSYGLCRASVVFGRCSLDFDNKDVAWLAAIFRKPEEVKEMAKKRNKCLYGALKMLAHKAKKVVATYDYVVSHPALLEQRDLIVFDEAQTILNYVDEVAVSINNVFVEQLVRELKKSIETRPIAYALRSIYRKSSGLREFIDKLTTMLSEVRAESELVSLLEDVVKAYYGKHYHVEGDTYYFLIDTLPRIARVGRKVFMGAFLPPMFLQSAKKATVIRIEGEPRIKAYIDTSVTTRYEERSEELYRELAKKVAERLREDCGNLVVFPSREVKDAVLKYVPEDVARKIITDFGKGVPGGGIIVDVAGGRLTEGVNILGLGNVVIAGMPYPEPNPILNLLSKVYGFDSTYTYLALLRTFQAVGRIRGSGTAYLLDKRFEAYKSLFPSWIEVV